MYTETCTGFKCGSTERKDGKNVQFKRVKPKNRKQKKKFKSQSYRMRKVAKGEYEVTTYCPFNVKLFSKIMSLLEKNENGEFWFNIDKK